MIRTTTTEASVRLDSPIKKAAVLIVLAAIYVSASTRNRYVLGIEVLLLGLFCLLSAMRYSDDEMRSRLRGTVGPGWFIGRIMATVPGSGAKLSFIALSLAIIALGAVELAFG